MKKSLLVLICLAASAAQASIAPPCDPTTFEGQSTCGGGVQVTMVMPPPELPPVPEPSTVAMLLAGMVGVVIAKRKHLVR